MATGGTICLTVRGGKSINIDNPSQFGMQIGSLVFFDFFLDFTSKRHAFWSSDPYFQCWFELVEDTLECISELGF